MTPNDPAGTAAPARPGWSADDVAALGALVGRLRGGGPPVDTAVLVSELTTAHEELRVADEELRVQREALTELLGDRRAGVRQREWLASLLPVPMMTTTVAGVVVSANVAAAGLLSVPVGTLVTKPLAAYVHPDDRVALRTALAVGHGEPTRLELRLAPRRAEPVPALVAVTGDGPTGGHLTWTVLAAGEARMPGARSLDALRLVSAFAEICAVPASDGDLHQLLARLADVALRSITGATSVSLALGPPDAPSRVATTSQAAAAVDGLQIQVGEGPCVTAFADREVVLSPDLGADDRWPALAARVTATGVRSAVAAPLEVDGELVGALNVYSTEPAAFDEDRTRAAELLAVAIGSILQGVWSQQHLRELVDQLNRALESRGVIDQAKGIVMARHGGTADEAFARLSRLSQERNIKLRDIARIIVEQAAAQAPLSPRRP